jgi:hypothetical protein
MASPLGTHVSIDCPLCPDQVNVPVTPADGDDNVLTVSIDFGAWRDHIAATHTRRKTAQP